MYIGNLNSIQTIYTVFFAIYYGITISRTIDLSLFDTPSMYGGIKRYPKSWLRFGLSFLFINVIPLFYFWFVMKCLDSINGNEAYKNFYLLFIVFIQSIVGFGYYRILVGILTCKKDDQFYFYDYSLYYPHDIPIFKFLLHRPITQGKPSAHICPGILWISITILLLNIYFCLPKLLSGICWLLVAFQVFAILICISNKESDIDYSASFRYLHLG